MTLLTLALTAWLSPAQAGEDLEFSLEGYYRVRVHHFNGLYDPESWTNEPGTGRYTQQRLRLQPTFNYQDRAKFIMQADIFDDTLWGDNTGLASTALFAEIPTSVGINGQPGAAFTMKRAWMEFKLPVGTMRVGRQGSHWGMGILANGGDGFDDTWGENHSGTTFDRVLFATKPISVVQGLRGKDDPNIPLFALFAVDRLVEDPLVQYYGYKCDPDDPDDDPRCAPDEDHGYSESRETGDRPDNWWTEHDDDVVEFVYGVLYRGESLQWGKHKADLTLGGYVVNRRQLETQSNAWILDMTGRLDYRWLYSEFEVLTIRGCSEALALPGEASDCSAYGQPPGDLAKTPRVPAAVGRVGYQSQKLAVTMEGGFASGDDNPADAVFTGRPMNSDYNVGLLLYEELLSRVSALRWTETGRGLWSNGGVYNSTYVFPNVRYTPIPNWHLQGAFLVAFPHKPDGAVILTDDDADSRILGWEADLALKSRWHDHVLFSLEGGLAQLSDRIPYQDLGLTKDGRVWTVQSRVAYEF